MQLFSMPKRKKRSTKIIHGSSAKICQTELMQYLRENWCLIEIENAKKKEEINRNNLWVFVTNSLLIKKEKKKKNANAHF
jgi:hypothetical protein